MVCLCSQDEGVFVNLLSSIVVGGGRNLVSRLTRTRGGIVGHLAKAIGVVGNRYLFFCDGKLGLACVTIQVIGCQGKSFPCLFCSPLRVVRHITKYSNLPLLM